MDAFFTEVKQRSVKTEKGTYELPLIYRDGSQFGAFYRIDLKKARALLEDTTVEPWPVLGAALGAIYVWEYRDSSVGIYNEVGLGIQARRRGTKPSLIGLARDMRPQEDQGIWVVNLPVTTPGACEAGIDLWGYPKYVTPIATAFDDDRASVRLGDELELSIPHPRGPRMRLPVVTYTARAGRLLRTVIDVDHQVRFGRGASLRLLGDGPTAISLRKLGVDDRAQPIAVFRTDTFRAILPSGVDIGAAYR